MQAAIAVIPREMYCAAQITAALATLLSAITSAAFAAGRKLHGYEHGCAALVFFIAFFIQVINRRMIVPHAELRKKLGLSLFTALAKHTFRFIKETFNAVLRQSSGNIAYILNKSLLLLRIKL